jgi:hypothetical protein
MRTEHVALACFAVVVITGLLLVYLNAIGWEGFIATTFFSLLIAGLAGDENPTGGW